MFERPGNEVIHDVLNKRRDNDKGDLLEKAFQAYKKVAEFLKPVWERSPKVVSHGIELLKSHADNIRNAKKAEEEGINHIKKYLGQTGGSPRASISLD